MGVGDAWGTEQELQHPRDSRGRFRSTWKMAAGVVDKILSALSQFNPKLFASDQEAQNYVKGQASRDRFLSNRKPAIDRFLRGFSDVNRKLEAGDTSSPDVAVIDKAMTPIPEDLVLTRKMTPESFGLNAQNIGQIEELTGKLVASKGYTSAGIGTPYQRSPGTITMTIAAPAGTKAVIPNLSQPSKELILGRNQPLRITKVDPDGQGGWNVLAVADDAAEGEAPVDITRAVPDADAQSQPEAGAPDVGGAAPVAVTPAPAGAGGPGRPPGPGPAPRNDGHVGIVGQPGGQQEIGVPAGQQPAPGSAPEPVPDIPDAPEAGPDTRNTFRQAFEEAKLKVPAMGPRRKQFEDAYGGIASGKKTPQEAVNDLDNAIAMNRRVLDSDKEDGTDSGPLEEDIKRQEALSDLIKEHFNFTGRKDFKAPEEKAPPAKKAAPEKKPSIASDLRRLNREEGAKKAAAKRATKKAAAPAAPAKKAAAPAPVQGDVDKMSVAELRAEAKRLNIPVLPAMRKKDIADAIADERRGGRRNEAGVRAVAEDAKARDVEITRAQRERVGQIRREMRAEREARGESKETEEQKARKAEAAEKARELADRQKAEIEAQNAKLDADAAKVANGWLADAGISESDLTDTEKVGLRLVSGQLAQGKISKVEAKRRLSDSKSANLKKIGDSIKLRKPVQRKAAPAKKAAPGKKDAPAPEAVPEAKPAWGTLKSQGIKPGDVVMFYGHDRRKMGTGRRVRVEKSEPYGGYILVDPDTGERVSSFGVANRAWYGPDTKKAAPEKKDDSKAVKDMLANPKVSTETKEVIRKALDDTEIMAPAPKAEKGLAFMKVDELRQKAKDEGIKIPSKFRRKQDIVDFLVEALVEKERGPDPDKKSDKAPDLDKMTIPQMRKKAEEEGLQIPRPLRLKAEIHDWLRSAISRKGRGEPPRLVQGQREIRRQNNAARARLKALGPLPGLKGADLKRQFDRMDNADDAQKLLDQQKYSRAELLEVAKDMNIAVNPRANMAEIRKELIFWGIKRRLAGEAVRRPGPGVRLGTENRRIQRLSSKPKLSNKWGQIDRRHPVQFHPDGEIGRFLDGLGDSNGSLDVDGDRLDNVLGKMATETVHGDLHPQDQVTKIRQLARRFDEGSSLRRRLEKLADDLDAPPVKAKRYPDDTPPVLQKLADELARIPLARKPKPSGDLTELQALDEIVDQWQQGHVGPIRLVRGIRNLANGRHESFEGKFAIDHRIADAADVLDNMQKADRDRLIKKFPARDRAMSAPLPKSAPRAALPVKQDLSNASTAQLRAIANAEGVKIPNELKSRKEIADFLNDVEAKRLAAVPAAPKKPLRDIKSRLRSLQRRIDTDPDAHVAVGFGGSPSQVIQNIIEGVQRGKFDSGQAASLLKRINHSAKSPKIKEELRKAIQDLDEITLSKLDQEDLDIPKYHVTTAGLEDLMRQVTPESIADAKAESISDGQVGINRKLTLADGTELFEKVSKDWGPVKGKQSTDAEQLASLMGQAIGAPVLPTLRPKSTTIYTPWVRNAKIGNEIFEEGRMNPKDQATWDRIKDSKEAKLLGLLDMLMGNGDRHSGNWVVGEDGKLVGLDNGMGWAFMGGPTNPGPGRGAKPWDLFGALADQGRFLRRHIGKSDIDFSLSDIEEIRKRMEALRPQFKHLNREEWLDFSLEMLKEVRRRATGSGFMY